MMEFSSTLGDVCKQAKCTIILDGLISNGPAAQATFEKRAPRGLDATLHALSVALGADVHRLGGGRLWVFKPSAMSVFLSVPAPTELPVFAKKILSIKGIGEALRKNREGLLKATSTRPPSPLADAHHALLSAVPPERRGDFARGVAISELTDAQRQAVSWLYTIVRFKTVFQNAEAFLLQYSSVVDHGVTVAGGPRAMSLSCQRDKQGVLGVSSRLLIAEGPPGEASVARLQSYGDLATMGFKVHPDLSPRPLAIFGREFSDRHLLQYLADGANLQFWRTTAMIGVPATPRARYDDSESMIRGEVPDVLSLGARGYSNKSYEGLLLSSLRSPGVGQSYKMPWDKLSPEQKGLVTALLSSRFRFALRSLLSQRSGDWAGAGYRIRITPTRGEAIDQTGHAFAAWGVEAPAGK